MEELKQYIEIEYKKIFSDMYISFTLDIRNKEEELSERGLLNSGYAIKIYQKLIEDIIFNGIEKFESIIRNAQELFRMEVDDEFLKKISRDCIISCLGMANSFEKDMSDRLRNRNLMNMSTASVSLFFSGLKNDINSKINTISKKISLVNNGRRKVSDKNVHIGILNANNSNVILGDVSKSNFYNKD